jgi:hypothetical protein
MPSITKDIIIATLDIAKKIIDNQLSGKRITKEKEPDENKIYNEKIKPELLNFANKFGNSPNKILGQFLQDFVSKNKLNDDFDVDHFQFYGQKVNPYVWACITKKENKLSKMSNYPQLFVSINDRGVIFGFGYGTYVPKESIFVKIVNSDIDIQKQLNSILNNNHELGIYPEDPLFTKKQVEKQREKALGENTNDWSKNHVVIQFYTGNAIPDDIEERISKTLGELIPLLQRTTFAPENEKEKPALGALGQYDIYYEILSPQQKQWKKDWLKIWADGEKTIDELENALSSTTLNKEDAISLIDQLPSFLKSNLSNLITLGFYKKDNELDIFKEVLSLVPELKKIKNYDDAKKIIPMFLKIPEVGISVFSSLASIINKDLFMAIWGHGLDGEGCVINKHIMAKLGIHRFVGSDENVDEFIRFTKGFRNAAVKLSISNMFEVAYYLSKYPGDGNLTPTNDPIFKELSNLLKVKNQLIIYGPPGTGKSYIARKCFGSSNDEPNFISFHSSYSYEDFIEGLKPIHSKTHELEFEVQEGIFKKKCRDAYNGLMSFCQIEKRWEKAQNGEYCGIPALTTEEVQKIKGVVKQGDFPIFYLIIDEINRGDISRIFGELITLLEKDKRLFSENQITATLPYSKCSFGVPPNLYIVGTMNNSDRSIALIDVALRRRFGFYELMPDYNLLLKALVNESSKDIAGFIKTRPPHLFSGQKKYNGDELKSIAIIALFNLNKRITELYDRDHQIGHSYLLDLKNYDESDKIKERLREIWYYEIIPLLQEYFYDSRDKLEKALGKSFIKMDGNSYAIISMSDDAFIAAIGKIASEQSVD